MRCYILKFLYQNKNKNKIFNLKISIKDFRINILISKSWNCLEKNSFTFKLFLLKKPFFEIVFSFYMKNYEIYSITYQKTKFYCCEVQMQFTYELNIYSIK